MTHAFIGDYTRTPIGRFGVALAAARADDLGAGPHRALCERNPGVDWEEVDDVVFGCANQAGEKLTARRGPACRSATST